MTQEFFGHPVVFYLAFPIYLLADQMRPDRRLATEAEIAGEGGKWSTGQPGQGNPRFQTGGFPWA
jgi:hypothetical protein